MRAMQEARRAILPPISTSASWANHGPKLRNSNKKIYKKCSGNKWWELATKIENKMAPAF
jgi:hypothetical protein